MAFLIRKYKNSRRIGSGPPPPISGESFVALMEELERVKEQRDELYDALKELLAADISGSISNWYSARNKAIAALAKADGKE